MEVSCFGGCCFSWMLVLWMLSFMDVLCGCWDWCYVLRPGTGNWGSACFGVLLLLILYDCMSIGLLIGCLYDPLSPDNHRDAHHAWLSRAITHVLAVFPLSF